MSGVGSAPIDDNGKPVLALLNDATGQVVPVHVGATVTGADGKTYAKLDVNASVTASVASNGTTGAAVPGSADYIGFSSGGNLVGVSAGNPLPITGSISASNPSVGTDGSAIPTSSTLLGASDGTNLQQLLVESSSQRNLRTAIFNAGNELAIDASGRLTLVPNSSANVAQIAGVAPGLDNTNELRTSIYGKNAAAGDTPVLVDASGRPIVTVNSLPALPAGTNIIGSVKLADSAGSNLLAIDASGRLTLVPNSSINIAQWGGVAPGNANPVIIFNQISAYINAGQGFATTTGKLISGGANQSGLSLFNPNASGKTLIIFSIQEVCASSIFGIVNLTTTDPALGSSPVVGNLKPGGASSVATASFNNANVAAAGTTLTAYASGASIFNELLTNNAIIVIPANNGIAVYLTNATNNWMMSMKWLEV